MRIRMYQSNTVDGLCARKGMAVDLGGCALSLSHTPGSSVRSLGTSVKTDFLADESVICGTHCSDFSTGTHVGHWLALHVPDACLPKPIFVSYHQYSRHLQLLVSSFSSTSLL